MRIRIILVITLTLAASGCAYTNSGDAEEMLELASKADQSQYHVTYNFSMEGKALLGQISEKSQLYAYDGETRFERKTAYAQGNTTTSIYNMEDNQAVTCTESTYYGNKTSQRECNVTNATVSRYIDGMKYSESEYSVNYVEEKEYAGRKCELYSIGLPPSEFENSSVINSGAIVDLCLDKHKGYVAYNSMKLTASVNSGGSDASNLYKLEALGYSPEVKKKQVEPPEFSRTEGNSTDT